MILATRRKASDSPTTPYIDNLYIVRHILAGLVTTSKHVSLSTHCDNLGRQGDWREGNSSLVNVQPTLAIFLTHPPIPDAAGQGAGWRLAEVMMSASP